MIAVAIPAHLAALYALLARPDRVAYSVRIETVETRNVIHFPAPPVVVPIPQVAPPVTSRVCPAPNTKARAQLAEELPASNYVYASPTNADWVVTWNDASIYFSSNGGKKFDEVLQGKGRVYSVAIDCFGHVIAARGTEIGVRDGTSESWHDLPGIDLQERTYSGGYDPDPPDVWVVGGGPDVVVVGFQAPATDWHSRVAMSNDLAHSWSYRDLSTEGFEGTKFAGRQLASGRIEMELEIVDCGGEWMETHVIDKGEVSRVEDPQAPDGISDDEWRAKVIKREPWRDSTISIDAAGRRWGFECGGHLTIFKKGEGPGCPEGNGNE